MPIVVGPIAAVAAAFTVRGGQQKNIDACRRVSRKRPAEAK
jgi:hypothetical protein